jgi:predicted DNA-binding protein with PD1-like motif
MAEKITKPIPETLDWVTHDKIPTDNLFGKGEGAIEILSMNGSVVDGQAHIHITLSDPNSVFGGQMEPGCIAYGLCEIFFVEVEGATLTRQRVPIAIEGMGSGEVSRFVFEK